MVQQCPHYGQAPIHAVARVHDSFAAAAIDEEVFFGLDAVG
jgi:hypothetical protein